MSRNTPKSYPLAFQLLFNSAHKVVEQYLELDLPSLYIVKKQMDKNRSGPDFRCIYHHKNDTYQLVFL